jgi:Ser/Thr protein kinase RdoA (MazF antagonist)
MTTAIARAALEALAFSPARLEALAQTHHPVFAVWADGRAYVLRLQDAQERPIAAVQAELELLAALAQVGDMPVVRAAALPGEAAVTLADHDGRRYTATLFQRCPGRIVALGDATPAQAAALGAWLGRFHRVGAGVVHAMERPLPDLTGARMLDRYQAALHDPPAQWAPAGADAVFREVAAHYLAAAPALASHSGLIHGDLLLANVMFNEEAISCVLDFEYAGHGYHLVDLAPFLWQVRSLPRPELLEEALLAGYLIGGESAWWSDDLLETVLAFRQLLSCYWVAANRHLPAVRANWASLIAARARELRAYLATGRLVRAPIG